MKWAATLSVAMAILNAVAASPTFLLDTTFPNGTGPDGTVRALAIQPDARLLISGDFTNVNGIARARLARLLPDGSLDPSFSHEIGGLVSRVSPLADGRILISGNFTNVGAVYAPGIARLFPDGSHDPSFNAPAQAWSGIYQTVLPAGDGRVWISGSFTNVGPVRTIRLARLLEDGSPDPTFVSPLKTSDTAPLIMPLPNSRLLVAGQPTWTGSPSVGLVRLNADGTIDPTFQSPFAAGTFVRRLMMSKDGRVLVNVPSFSPRSLLRLMDDGAIDDSFHAEFSFSSSVITLGTVLPLLVQSDAKVIVSGPFFGVNGIPRPGLARLNSDGSTDLCFDVGLGTDTVLAAVDVPDRSIVTAGYFHTVEGVGRNFIARLRPQSECTSGTLDFSTPVTRTTEDAQRVTMSIVRTGGEVGEVSVDFATADGSAVQGKNYQAASGTIQFAPGERVQSISIPLLNDPSVTGERTFDVRLGNPGGGAALGVLSEATVVIADVPFGQVAGRVDTNFVVRLDGTVRSLLRLPDGRFLVAMGLTNFSTGTVKGLRRLLADGSPDTQFVATNEFDGDVAGVLQLPDARILAWGEFSSINGVHVVHWRDSLPKASLTKRSIHSPTNR